MCRVIPRQYALALPAMFVAASSTMFTWSAAAQTCEAPLLLTEGVNHANTCLATNSLPVLGSLWIPHRDVVYAFTISAGMGNGTISVDADFPAVFLLVPAPCSTSSEPVAMALPGEPMFIDGSLPPGAYYVVATGEPGLGGDICGLVALTPKWPGGVFDVIFVGSFEFH